MNQLRFGTGGIPNSCKGTTIDAIEKIKELNLDAMELEFVRNINLTPEKAKQAKEKSKKNDVVLTCHGSYYTNLNSPDEKKIEASIKRIVSAAERAHQAGAYSITFHPGFYMKTEKELAYQTTKAGFKEIIKKLKDKSINIWVRPETTGKASAIGSFEECIRLSEDVEQVLPCIDFAHLHARSGGKNNTKKEWRENLELFEKRLGARALKEMHIHTAGIAYTQKGEKHHLNLKESDLRYADLIKIWKEFKIKGVVICESPNLEKDAQLMKETYNRYKDTTKDKQ